MPVTRNKIPNLAKYDAQVMLKWFAEHGLIGVAEHQFCDGRKWRFDFAFPDALVALEVEGGVWNGGRHTRGSGFVKDIEKYNTAASLGWLVLRTTPSELGMQETVDLLKTTIKRSTARTGKQP